jgi:hypothetical protein
MEQAGFPSDHSPDRREGRSGTHAGREFAQLRRHSIHHLVLERGAMEIWMPRLNAAKAVEDRQVAFIQAMDA